MRKVVEVNGSYIRGSLKFYTRNSGIGVSKTEVNGNGLERGKYAILDSDVYNLLETLNRKTHISSDYCAGDPIYLYPEARVSRDLVRQSGYTITRSPEKGQFRVIPEPDDSAMFDIEYHIAFVQNGTLCLFTVSSDCSLEEVPDDKFDAAKERLIEWFDDKDIEFLSKNMKLKRCTFMPQYEAYKDIVEAQDVTDFVFDTNIKLQPNVDISIQTLDVWRRLNDNNMLAKFICASNWEEYPFTLKIFLDAEASGIRYMSNKNIKMICRKIGLFGNDSESRSVTKADYNMLMSYIFHKMGKELGPTYITEKEYNSLPYEYRKFLRKKVAVSPVPFKLEEEIVANLEQD